MTTDITELAQSLKEPAKQAIELGCINNYAKGRHAVLLFKSRATPEAVLSLVEALEKAQRHANLTEAERQAYLGLISKRDERIAELESRTVKIPGWFVKDAIVVYDRDEIEEALSAAGIKWEAE
ncbi:hypothetical protein ACT9TU_22930 [Raoultella planticola]|uniref:hypothetical protein n=1 Tax=Raoultella planticola TaxID=575 RepID=UPI00406912EF